MAEARPGTPRRLARSSSGVWWKLGDAASPEVEQRLRGIAEEEAGVRARMERRRKVALTSMSLEVVAFSLYGLWRRRRALGWGSKLLPAALATVPAIVLLAAFARFRNILDGRDEQKLQRLAAERKSYIGRSFFRGSSSYHNDLHKYDDDRRPRPGAADNKQEDDDELSLLSAAAASTSGDGGGTQLKRTRSRLSLFHLGNE